MKCSEILEKFLLEQKVKGNSDETVLYYKKRIKYFIDFVNNKDTHFLNIDDYNNYALFEKSRKSNKNINLSSATIKTELNAVKIFLNYCSSKGFSNIDFSSIKPYKLDKKVIVVLSNLEIEKLLKSQHEFTLIGIRNLLAISLMLDAGLRVSEVINLNIDDINEELGLIRVFGKGHKERLVPLTDTILNYYKKYTFLTQYKTGALFLDFDTGNRLTSSGISQILRRIKKDVGFKKLHPHYLRHTFATLFLVNGGDPIHLKTILGHETLYMTEHYIHLANQMTMSEKKKFSPLSNLKKA